MLKKLLEKLKPYKIGVLAGGVSSEREISLRSGRAVFNALNDVGLNAKLVDISDEDFSPVIERADFNLAFISLHGKFGEDGAIQAMLEKENMPYTGSDPSSSKRALDKIESKKIFMKNGLLIPEYCVVRTEEDLAKTTVALPCVVKPRYEGSSIGLSIVDNRDKLADAVKEALRFGKDVLIEEFISGREITVGILNENFLPVVEIVTARGVYDFNAKYEAKDTRYIVPAKLDRDIYLEAQKIGLKAHQALGCRDFSRVDMIVSGDGKIYLLEVNTIPGLTERSLLPMAAKAAGIDFSELCIRMLTGALADK
ncbi:MAG: D-alanine--D-alanine ligase [Candidatus Omnitrophica bacterium]|nr:D-alanine--D-alanine ligase [Candidatus Omnitrophota bacterium]